MCGLTIKYTVYKIHPDQRLHQFYLLNPVADVTVESGKGMWLYLDDLRVDIYLKASREGDRLRFIDCDPVLLTVTLSFRLQGTTLSSLS